MLQGRWLLPADEDGLVVNAYMLKKEPDIHLGDEIVLKLNGRERTWRVVGVCLGGNPSEAYANYAPVARLTGNVGQASAMLVATQQHDSNLAAQVAQALESHFKAVGIHADQVQTMDQERDKDQANFGILIVGLLAMAILFAAVGGLGLMGTMSINVLERTREIGVLRAIGASSGNVAQVFVLESAAIGVLSWLLGCVFAVPLGKLMSDAVGTPLMGVPITFTFSMAGVWLWLVVVVLLSIVASFVPARNASRLTVRQVLAYE
jgi:putative ABC transport system permease protein